MTIHSSPAGLELRRRSVKERRLFVLDTNVLMHDPAAMLRFQEHDVFLPMVVLEELDTAKKGLSEVARNVRQVTRMLDDLIEGTDAESIEEGVPLPGASPESPSGRLFFQTQSSTETLPDTLPGLHSDNSILGTALALQRERPGVSVILVSKDINLRIKATGCSASRRGGLRQRSTWSSTIVRPAVHAVRASSPTIYWREPGVATCETPGRKGGRAYYDRRKDLRRPRNGMPNQFVYMAGDDAFEAHGA